MDEFDVVVVVPLSEEFQTVKEVFGVQETFVRNKLTFYVLEPPIQNSDINIVAVVLNRMGNPTAAQKTERILSTIEGSYPKLVALVGIAGRLDDDFRLGDVVIADQITNYDVRTKIADSQPATENSEDGDSADTDGNPPTGEDGALFGNEGLPLIDWQPGGITRHTAEEVTEAVAKFRNDQSSVYDEWQKQTESTLTQWIDPKELDELSDDESLSRDSYQPPARARLCPIASGGLVVASTQFSRRLARQNRNFAAVEMEAAGVMASVHRTDGVNAMVIRGISDFADENKSALENIENADWRKCAVFSAASYLHKFLSAGLLDHAKPNGGGTTGPVHNDHQTIPHEALSSDTIEVIKEGGPATNFIRPHYFSDDSVLRSKEEKRGISVTVEFEIQSSEELFFTGIYLDVEGLSESDFEQQRVMVDWSRVQMMDATDKRLGERVLLEQDDKTTIRVVRRYRCGDRTVRNFDQKSNTATEIVLIIPTQGGQEAQYTINGRIGHDEGLVTTQSNIK